MVEILWNEFYDEISPDEVEKKAREWLPECQVVFVKYNLNDHYADTPE